MNIGDLFFSLRANDARLQQDVKKAGDKAGTTLGQSLSSSIKKSFSGAELGKGLVQGLGLAGALGAANLAASGFRALTDFIGDSTEAASALNETVSKGRVIFGDNADEMEAWAGTASRSFGQSKRAALDTASTFAGLFDTVGLSLDDATAKSRTLTELGSDLASFFNTDVAQATEALRSGLSGEAEPLRRFNIFLSETAVSAKLIEMGQKKVNGQWTEAQKILGRYQIIMDQTTAAQGDFARTSDQLANSERTKAAILEDEQAMLGQKFLPIALQITQWQIDFIEGADLVAQKVGELANGFAFLADKATTALDVLTFWDERTHGLTQKVTGEFIPNIDNAARSMEHMADASKDAAVAIQTIPVMPSFSVDPPEPDEIKRGLQAGLEVLRQTIAGEAGDLARELAAGGANLATVSAELARQLPDSVRANREEVRRQAVLSMVDYAAGLRDKRSAVMTAIELLNSDIENALSRRAEANELIAALGGENIAKGLASKDPVVKAQAQGTVQLIADRLRELEVDAGKLGGAAGQNYADALGDTAPLAKTAGNTVAGSGATGLSSKTDDARGWGYKTGKAYADGIRATWGLVHDAAYYVANAASGPMKASSPPGPESPLHEIDVWGERTAQAWIDGFASKVRAAGSAVAAFTGAAAAGLQPMSLASAVSVPTARSFAMAGAGGVPAPPAASKHIEYHIHAEGQLKVPDPLAAANLLARFQGEGMLPEDSE